MEIKVFKGNSFAYIADIFGALSGESEEKIKISIIEPAGDEVLYVGAKRYVMHGGEAEAKASDFYTDRGSADVRLYSGDGLYIVEGIVCQDGRLRLDDATIQKYVSRLIIENYDLRKRCEKCEKKIEELMGICSGDDFL